MESTKDGSEVVSFQLKSKASVRIRCSLYAEDNDVYIVPEDVLLTNWKSHSSIIETVHLQPLTGKSGKYTLHPASTESLLKLGILPYNVESGDITNEEDTVNSTSLQMDEENFTR